MPTIAASGTVELAAAFGRIGAALQPPLRLWRDTTFRNAVRRSVSDSMKRAWASGGANIGTSWDPHDLVKTGDLRQSMTSLSQLKTTVTPDALIFGSSLIYAPHVEVLWGHYLEIDREALAEIKSRIAGAVGRRVLDAFRGRR